MKVYLSDVIEAIEFENESLSHYFNKKTGIIIYKEDSKTSRFNAEDIKNIEEYEEWEKELIINLYDLEKNPEDYIKLPDVKELNEYNMMIKFIASLNKKILKDTNNIYELHELKKLVENKGLLNEWYDFRQNEEKIIAVNWCKKNNIQLLD